jgi:hypothetical protein
MIQGKRFGLSEAQKGDMWRRWKVGQSLHEIGRAFGRTCPVTTNQELALPDDVGRCTSRLRPRSKQAYLALLIAL